MLRKLTVMQNTQISLMSMKNLASSLPEIRELQSLVAIARTGSISKAARSMDMHQTTLSYVVDRLRKRMGDPLFVRVGNRMEPTPYAQQLIRAADHVLEVMSAEFLGIEKFDPAVSEREFRVVFTEAGAITLLPGLVKHLSETAPHTRLTPLHAGGLDLESALADGRADLAVGTYNELKGSEGIYQQLLFTREYVLVARRDHPTLGDAITLEQLAAMPQVANAVASAGLIWLKNHVAEQQLQLNIVFTLEHVVAIPMLVGASDFIALITQEFFDIFQHCAGIRTVELPFAVPAGHIRQHWHPRMHQDPAVQFLRRAMHEVAKATQLPSDVVGAPT